MAPVVWKYCIHGTNPGPRPYLSSSEESELAAFLVDAAKMGHGPPVVVSGPLASSLSGPPMDVSGPLLSIPSGPLMCSTGSSMSFSSPLMSLWSSDEQSLWSFNEYIWSSGERSLWSMYNWSSDEQSLCFECLQSFGEQFLWPSAIGSHPFFTSSA